MGGGPCTVRLHTVGAGVSVQWEGWGSHDTVRPHTVETGHVQDDVQDQEKVS